MSERLIVHYDVLGDDVEAVADALRVEQSIEFPNELAPQWIQDDVVGQVISITRHQGAPSRVVISYALGSVGGEIPQLINVLWGNASMLSGIRVVHIDYPQELLKLFKGPRFGIDGLREYFSAPRRPLASTALKPMGLSSQELANIAYTLALEGFDTVKDDHSLANQPWSLWEERVATVAEAVAAANAKSGNNCIYAPSLNLPAHQILGAAHRAKELGAGSLLMLPGISGWDMMRAVAEDDDIALPIMAHPSFTGSLVLNPEQGLTHGIVLAQWARLSGADITIFPNFGGRFGFSQAQCVSIAEAARAPLGHLKSIWISPAGGMSIERIDAMIGVYGTDTACLIGGALHRGDLGENARQMVSTIAAAGS